NPLARSAGPRPRPAHRPSVALPETDATCCHGRTPRRPQPRPPWRRNPVRDRSCAVLTPAWWQTGATRESRPHYDALDPQPTPAECRVRGPPAPRPCHSRSRETRPPGCSRCVQPCRCIDASRPSSGGPSSGNPYHRRSAPRRHWTTPPAHNCVSGPAPDRHPTAPGPTGAGPHKEMLRPSTRPTASRSCVHSFSATPANTQDSAHESPNAQTNPRSDHAHATTPASILTVASPWHRPENHKNRAKSAYHLSTTVVLGCQGILQAVEVYLIRRECFQAGVGSDGVVKLQVAA